VVHLGPAAVRGEGVLRARAPAERDESAHRGQDVTVVLRWGFRPWLILPLPEDAFAKTSLGKIQRKLIRQRLEAGEYAQTQARLEELIQRQLGGHTPPNGPTESAVAELYAELFETDPRRISVTASFFDLGGTSLDILRLKGRIAKSFPGNELPLTAILAAPTARDLARRIDTGRSAEPIPYDPVITLQPDGGKTPLFCVHPGVGEVLVFVNLAKHFLHERPFHALRARGFGAGEQTFQSFEEMVGSYAEAIRTRQPHGPYALAGYSFGAAVAFEIAKLFEADGERVGFLGNFNLPPHIKDRMEELEFVDTAVNLAMFLDLIPKQQAQELAQQLRPLSRAEQLAHLIAVAPPARLHELDLDQERLGAWADLASGLTRLARTYEPSGKVAAMTIFCAAPFRGTRQEWMEKLSAWDKFAGEARYVPVSGEHYTLMGPRHLAEFQATLRTELDRAMPGG
jgi:thioesterase domain-containing protein